MALKCGDYRANGGLGLFAKNTVDTDPSLPRGPSNPHARCAFVSRGCLLNVFNQRRSRSGKKFLRPAASRAVICRDYASPSGRRTARSLPHKPAACDRCRTISLVQNCRHQLAVSAGRPPASLCSKRLAPNTFVAAILWDDYVDGRSAAASIRARIGRREPSHSARSFRRWTHDVGPHLLQGFGRPRTRKSASGWCRSCRSNRHGVAIGAGVGHAG